MSKQSRFTPSSSVDMLRDTPSLLNKQTNTVINYLGFEVSVSTGHSPRPGALLRSDVRIFSASKEDVTNALLQRQNGMVLASGENLKIAFAAIEREVATLAALTPRSSAVA